MAVFSQAKIRDRLSRRIDDDESLVVTPLLSESTAFAEDALDIRLGTHFMLPANPPSVGYVPGLGESQSRSHQHVHIPLGQYLVVPAHQTLLGMTLEFVKLPYDASGLILTKSSIARMFVVIETAPWIHPGYRGCLTLEIANVSNTPIVLYPGRAIGQLILMQVDGATRGKGISGTYVGPVFPEAPRFRSPEDELTSIGVAKELIKLPRFE